jgi:16S rRNA processing protein RimM
LPQDRILLGVIGRPHGVRGLLHVHSYTADPADLSRYGALEDDRGRRFRLRWAQPGVAEVSEVVSGKRVPLTTREAAQALVNTRLSVPREKLPPPAEDEFYLADLIGLEAVDEQGQVLGRVETVHDYGAGASLEIGARILPFTRACVPVVDVAGGRIVVSLPIETEVRPDDMHEAAE